MPASDVDTEFLVPHFSFHSTRILQDGTASFLLPPHLPGIPFFYHIYLSFDTTETL
jgi:hypothetical protein